MSRAMHPLARDLNARIRGASPDVYALLSERGQRLYFPKGILSQTAEARDKAQRFNATIGVATEGHAPMVLASLASHLGDLEPSEAVSYAPSTGRPDLRTAWRERLLTQNPSLRGRSFGLPLVTSGITHGLALVGDLFIDPGDRLVLPAHLWGNYRLNYETRLGAQIETYPTYSESGGFNAAGLRATLASGPEKQLVLLNFPNNPTGYTPLKSEVAPILDALLGAAESGQQICVILDDAYFGLTYDKGVLEESLFGLLTGAHPRLLPIKVDGATKEVFAWGLRVGFLTFGLPGASDEPEALLSALESKAAGAIRSGISNSSQLSQMLVLAALRSPTLEAERHERFEILRARALRAREVAGRSKYRLGFDVHPFNSGYFMCIRLKSVDAEALRGHLLDRYGVGLIALGERELRIAFSSLEIEEIEPLFEILDQAISDLR